MGFRGIPHNQNHKPFKHDPYVTIVEEGRFVAGTGLRAAGCFCGVRRLAPLASGEPSPNLKAKELFMTLLKPDL